VRVRLAPSPTGSLHIGNLRTALFTWLFARHHNGAFILRIEDTDQKRYDPTALQTLMEALQWAGLQWDEGPDIGGPYGPYVQSERLPLYQQWAEWLIDQGYAYRAYDTPEELEQISQERRAKGLPPGYDRRHRDLTAEQRAAFEAEGRTPVVRFKMPLDDETVIDDAVLGELRFDNANQPDAVLLKSDGFPTYHLAHVVDEHFMEISHVTRSNEWVPSLPLHVQLWRAFDWEMPVYAHLPVLLNPNGKGKISKRKPPVDDKGHVIPVMVHDYMREGYLPEALVNFLTNVGWNFGEEREVFPVEEAIARFDFDRVNPANSTYPIEKLEWMNGHYINHILNDEELAKRLRPVLEDAGLEVNMDVLRQVVPLVKTRLKRLTDVIDIAGFFFHDEFKQPAPEDVIQKKMDAASTIEALERSISVIESLPAFDADTQLAAFDTLATELGLKRGQMFGALRVAVSGQRVSTPTFETMEILGREESLRRIKLAIEALKDLEKAG
jgi:glutamyl-tRNA synthetase